MNVKPYWRPQGGMGGVVIVPPPPTSIVSWYWIYQAMSNLAANFWLPAVSVSHYLAVYKQSLARSNKPASHQVIVNSKPPISGFLGHYCEKKHWRNKMTQPIRPLKVSVTSPAIMNNIKMGSMQLCLRVKNVNDSRGIVWNISALYLRYYILRIWETF